MVGAGGDYVSEHAFGDALDVAGFTLADGRTITVKDGWHGSPEEQGFLHDVQLFACETFSTVLAPGYNIYHYDHIHVDLMRRGDGRHPCRPDAIPGAVAAAKARVDLCRQAARAGLYRLDRDSGSASRWREDPGRGARCRRRAAADDPRTAAVSVRARARALQSARPARMLFEPKKRSADARSGRAEEQPDDQPPQPFARVLRRHEQADELRGALLPLLSTAGFTKL